MPNAITLTFSDAHALLKQIDHNPQSSTPTIVDRDLVRRALELVTERSDYQIFGVCADSFQQGMTALAGFLTALGYSDIPTLQPIQGTVYIKFKPNSDVCYVEPYNGQHRGVLISCQSYYADGISEMYGHLPLDLFV